MGAWGPGAFENDDACDWAFELAHGGLEVVRDGLSLSIGHDYLEAPDASVVIAAAEVVAAASGKPLPELPDEVVAFLRGGVVVDEELLAEACEAVDRVLGADSELHDLWKDSDEYEAWRGHVVGLKRRLSP